MYFDLILSLIFHSIGPVATIVGEAIVMVVAPESRCGIHRPLETTIVAANWLSLLRLIDLAFR